LASVAETFASLALSEYEPEDREKLEIKSNVVKRARKLGLCKLEVPPTTWFEGVV
jgi:hypothetical protein